MKCKTLRQDGTANVVTLFFPRFLLLSLCPGIQNVEIRAAGIRKTRLERARTPENGDGAQHFKANTGQRINP